MNKRKQKEPLSLMIAKTVLAIAVFTGIGTIIFGGGVLIMKYHNSKVNNRIAKLVDQETENYYDVLEKKCGAVYDSCCLSSLDIMRDGNYKEADKNGNCPDGFEMNMQKCITTFQWCVPIKELNIIGNYINGITSMCSQNCDRYYIGSYEIIDRLQDVDGNNRKEIVFANGDMIKILELPTIAGPDSRGQIDLKEVEAVKFQTDNYQKIDFPKISISEKEMSNYIENKNAEFNLKFENPLDRELKFKIIINDFALDFEGQNDFQYVALKPNEIKSIQYIYKNDDNSRNESDDSLNLVVINDFVDEENYRKYYWDEANNLNSSGTMIYIDKYIRLEDYIELDTSDWQTYRNEKFGYEFSYSKNDFSFKEHSTEFLFLSRYRHHCTISFRMDKIKNEQSFSDYLCERNVSANKEFDDKCEKFLDQEKLSGPGPTSKKYLGEKEISENVFAEVVSWSSRGERGDIYYILNGTEVVTILVVDFSGCEEEIDQLLSTFKFIEK